MKLKEDFLHFGIFELFNSPTIKITSHESILQPTAKVSFGRQVSGDLSTGYSNFFDKGEYIQVKSSVELFESPSFSLQLFFPKYSTLNLKRPIQEEIFSLFYKNEKFSSSKITRFGVEYFLPPFYAFSADFVHPSYFPNDMKKYFKISLNMALKQISSDFSNQIELSSILSDSAIISYLKGRVFERFDFDFGLSALFSGGLIISKTQVPIPERFHVGGAPFFRGIPYKEFSHKSQEIPIGNTAFFSFSFESSQYLFPQVDFNCHVFLNVSLAANFLQADFNFKKILCLFSLGSGFNYRNWPIQIETNVQIPLIRSSNLNFLHYQVGFLSSTELNSNSFPNNGIFPASTSEEVPNYE